MGGFGSGWILRKVSEQMDTILAQQGVIMADIQELKAKVATLTTAVTEFAAAVDAEQVEIQAAIDALALLVVNGGTEAERQAISDSLDSAISGLTAARTDLSSTIPDVPPPPVEPPVEPPTGGGETGVSGGSQRNRR